MAKKSKTIEALRGILATTYTLYLKTHNYHWNVKGPHFHTLHTMYELQYNELALAVDVLAERIRALGAAAPGGYKDFGSLSSIKDAKEELVDGEKTVKSLAEDHETLIGLLQKGARVAQKEGDEATADVLIARIEAHEKTAWMLKSTMK